MTPSQGDVVRQLKTQKADPDKIKVEVAKLLSLKQDLSAAQGVDPNSAAGGKKKRGKKK